MLFTDCYTFYVSEEEVPYGDGENIYYYNKDFKTGINLITDYDDVIQGWSGYGGYDYDLWKNVKTIDQLKTFVIEHLSEIDYLEIEEKDIENLLEVIEKNVERNAA